MRHPEVLFAALEDDATDLTTSTKKPAQRSRWTGSLGIGVGVAGFEPTTSTTPKWCATGLRYTPMRMAKIRRRDVSRIGCTEGDQ